MNPQHLIASLLVVAFAAVDAAVLLAMRLEGEVWPHWGAIGALGLGFGQTGFAAAYFVQGRANIAMRGAVLILVAGVTGYLGDRATGGDDFPVWWTLMLASSVPLLVVGAVARWYGVRIVHEDDVDREERPQFSIWWLLSLTTAVALAFGVARYLRLPPEELPAVILFSVAINLTPIVCVACGLSWQNAWLAFGLPLLSAPVFGVLLAFTGLPPPRDWLPLAMMSFVQSVCILAVCAVLRLTGYRLRGMRKKIGHEIRDEARRERTDAGEEF